LFRKEALKSRSAVDVFQHGGGTVLLKHGLKLLFCDFAVPQNLRQETSTHGLSPMDCNNRASTIRMPKKTVATLASNHFKAQST
jgi:hypothetical protein